MSNKALLIKKFYQSLSLLACETKKTRTYGTEHLLTSSDIDLLLCVLRNQSAKASDLSQYLGVTKGAVTQLAKKLEQKGFIEPYRVAQNKKEVYYKLTPQGALACRNHDAHFAKISDSIEQYIKDFDDATVAAVIGLFEVVCHSIEGDCNCSLKPQNNQNDCAQEAGDKRCEKCQKIY